LFKNVTSRIICSYERFVDTAAKTPNRTLSTRLGSLFNMGGQGGDTSAFVWPLIAGFEITGDARWLQSIQDGLGYVFGANTMSQSHVAQVGPRYPETIFNNDSYQMGKPTPKGIAMYGPYMHGQWAFAFNVWGSASNTGLVESPVPSYEPDYIFEREIEPNRYCWPLICTFDGQYNLGVMERSVQQTVLSTLVLCYYANGWDA
jgi:hypothetical protein